MNDSTTPIYKSNSVTKNGKRYDLAEVSFVFDCPHCEYITTSFNQEGAETALDMHYFHHHPEVYVPLFSAETKTILDNLIETFRLRTFSPVGQIRDASE